MTEGEDEGLVKVLVDLPNHWATGAESMWAKPLGNDEYELRNSPFYAYGLNWGDVVKAVAPEPDLKPIVLDVVRSSGNRTLRIHFQKSIARPEQLKYLDDLAQLGLSYERAGQTLIALDIDKDSDYGAICDNLWALEEQGILEYETCEQRAEGRFDDGPSDDEDNSSEYAS